MSLKIYLLRHGETAYSQRGAFCGSLDPDLTAEGKAMAQAFADVYRTTTWSDVYVSPMQRAIATAQPLCDVAGLTMQFRNGLREISYGAWEDQEQDYVNQRYAEDYLRWQTDPAWNPPSGGETAMQIAARALPVITEIQTQYKTGNVLLVSHKATIRILLCSLLGIDLGRYRDRINALAASVSIIKFTDYGPMLEVLGDRNHLPEHLRQRAGT
ncbi:histidine phosphatase family protein [Methylomonas methanica]|uniref:Phosphoglycerate mutase n=1 Tax=Methylomonas methanica TaxID=421 RepID=A0A177LU27_METMH|nr:histidine phosphatase family protein [Methylomonas methanica]OAH96181.1 phosphoglycerate mutase [Methylomonas methanica]OAH96976.1 phosphoglycerate mutase [Methylomonas methanica]